jgi:transposase
MEKKSRLSRSLVLGRRSDGRCRYDPDIKRELVEICQQPGVSVARIALEHGINANLLRQWIQSYREQVNSPPPSPAATLPAFAPVLSVTTPKSKPYTHLVELFRQLPLAKTVEDFEALEPKIA